MKRLIVREDVHGRHAEISAKITYQAATGEWIAEVDADEMRRACYELYRGVKECSLEDLHIEAAQDDDGKEYTVLTK